MPQLDITGHQIKSPVPRIGYSLLSHCQEGYIEPPLTIQTISKVIGYSP